MVSAYATSQRLTSGQLATDEKSHEITAIPELLKFITLEGCTVTIDATGCQKKISRAILNKKADYISGVKDNQKGLLEQIKKVFGLTEPVSCHTQNDVNRGRVEKRTCRAIDDLTFFDDYKDWPGIKSLIRVGSQRINKQSEKTVFDSISVAR